MALLALVVSGGAVQLLRPVPPPRLLSYLPSSFSVPGPAPKITWPAYGQASLYLEGAGFVATTPSPGPVPIASVTKLMTAMVVVGAHPLQPGQAGPTVAVTAADQNLYQQELLAGDSVVAVKTGEQLTEAQLLQGLLLPSADNFARMLAQWDAGTESAFVALMNREAARLGMTQTHYADASGLDPASSSTAHDLALLAGAVTGRPVLAGLVSLRSVVLPVAGKVSNYDFILGQDGVVGMKTGWTSRAGGCFVFASRRVVDGRSATLVGAVLGAPGGPLTAVEAAEAASLRILASAWPDIESVTPLPADRVGELVTGWAGPVPVTAGPGHAVLGWPGMRLQLRLRARRLGAAVSRGEVVGTVSVTDPAGESASVRIRADAGLRPPSVGWRLLNL